MLWGGEGWGHGWGGGWGGGVDADRKRSIAGIHKQCLKYAWTAYINNCYLWRSPLQLTILNRAC